MANKLLTVARDLHRRKARERLGLFLAEGVRAVEELLRSPLETRGLLIAAELGDSSRAAALVDAARVRGIAVETVGPRELQSAAETETPQGILAIGVVPSVQLADLPEISTAEPFRLLVLDAVQDPGNVGTILRTAAAFGVTATLSLPGTVDLWNAKVVRSGMGAQFLYPCLSGTWDELDTFRRERGLSVWAADAGGTSIGDLEPPQRLALVVGNEGAGLSAASRLRAEQLVALPIAKTVESLNVAVSVGILLYELRR